MREVVLRKSRVKRLTKCISAAPQTKADTHTPRNMYGRRPLLW